MKIPITIERDENLEFKEEKTNHKLGNSEHEKAEHEIQYRSHQSSCPSPLQPWQVQEVRACFPGTNENQVLSLLVYS